MKKSLILTALLVGLISFSGCGDDSKSGGGSGGSGGAGSSTDTGSGGGSGNGARDESSENGSGGGSGSGTSLSVQPVTKKIVCEPTEITSGKGSYKVRYAADGDITALCKKEGEYTFGKYNLVEGVDTLTITALEKVENYTVSTTKAKGFSTNIYNYKAGTIRHITDAVAEGKSIKYDCMETYPSPLPATLTDTDSIEQLLEWSGNRDDRLKSTCPKEYDDEDDDKDDSKDDMGKGTAEFISNYTFTDNNEKKHLITKTESMVFK